MKTVFKMLLTFAGVCVIVACGDALTNSNENDGEPASVVVVEMRILGQDDVRGLLFQGTMTNVGEQVAKDAIFAIDFQTTDGHLLEGAWSEPMYLPPNLPVGVGGNRTAIDRTMIARIAWRTQWYSSDRKHHQAGGTFTSF